MSRKEIMGTLTQWAKEKTVAGGYFAAVVALISKRPSHLDRLVGMGVKTPEELYKIAVAGW